MKETEAGSKEEDCVSSNECLCLDIYRFSSPMETTEEEYILRPDMSCLPSTMSCRSKMLHPLFPWLPWMNRQRHYESSMRAVRMITPRLVLILNNFVLRFIDSCHAIQSHCLLLSPNICQPPENNFILLSLFSFMTKGRVCPHYSGDDGTRRRLLSKLLLLKSSAPDHDDEVPLSVSSTEHRISGIRDGNKGDFLMVSLVDLISSWRCKMISS